MNEVIFKVLQALNQLQVHGEDNLNILLYAIQQLKPLQTRPFAPMLTPENKEDESCPS